jgi:hypothetical protein
MYRCEGQVSRMTQRHHWMQEGRPVGHQQQPPAGGTQRPGLNQLHGHCTELLARPECRRQVIPQLIWQQADSAPHDQLPTLCLAPGP